MPLNLCQSSKSLFLWAFVLCLAFSTVNTKIAGSAWGILVLAGLVVVFWKGFASKPQISTHSSSDKPAAIWLFATLAYCIVIGIMTWYWQDSYSASLAQTTWRLLAAAVATYALTVWGLMPGGVAELKKIYVALIAACVFAAILSFVFGRSTPSNPIPWAAGVGMLVCLLLPCCLQKEFGPVLRMASFFGAMAGILGILFSLSRGAFVIIPFALVFIVSVLLAHMRHVVWGRCAVLWGVRIGVGLLFGLFLFFFSFKETLTQGGGMGLPLQRVEQAHSEFGQAMKNFDTVESFQTSVGLRLHLWHFGWTVFLDSPWLGHGVQGRLNLVRNYQDDFFARHSKVSTSEPVGHVHNQFLNHLVDYGLLGLLPLLGFFLALFWIAWTQRAQRVVFWQASGLAVFIFSTLMTNANLVHNYFSPMWSLAVFVLCAQSTCFSKSTN